MFVAKLWRAESAENVSKTSTQVLLLLLLLLLVLLVLALLVVELSPKKTATTSLVSTCVTIPGMKPGETVLTGQKLYLRLRYSVYLLYWYKRTDTDAARSSGEWVSQMRERSSCGRTRGSGTHFTCFTGTNVQILAVFGERKMLVSQYICDASVSVCMSTIYAHLARGLVRKAQVLRLLALMVQKYKY
jgi:hypothetical protein